MDRQPPILRRPHRELRLNLSRIHPLLCSPGKNLEIGKEKEDQYTYIILYITDDAIQYLQDRVVEH